MLDFLKNILQLILSPGNAWEDLQQEEKQKKENEEPEALLYKGLFPLLGIMFATEFLTLFYNRTTTFGAVITSALCALGAYFVSIFIGKLIFEVTLPAVTQKYSTSKAFTVVVMGIGLMTVIQIIINCCPWKSVILYLLPVYVVLILYRANQFIGVKEGEELRYLGIVAIALVIVPITIKSALDLLI